MDDYVAHLNEAVAAAADAHLTDPLDTAVYERLVGAVLARRAHLGGNRASTTAGGARLRALPRVEEPSPTDVAAPADGESSETAVPLPTALDLSGDPRDVLARLRGGGSSSATPTLPE